MTPRLGFLGLGWIGTHRLRAIAESGLATVAALADPDPSRLAAAGELAPGARRLSSRESLLDEALDGVVIATPSGQHADDVRAALDRGLAVFCQKPLGRSAAEAVALIAQARRADRLLGVDLSYRHVAAFRAAHDLIAPGGIGEPYALSLVFHNAYGPDRPWYYERARAGGGCLIDLGIHLVDLICWIGGEPSVEVLASQLFRHGRRWVAASDEVEDYAVAQLRVGREAAATLACSWRAPAGADAQIEMTVFGSRGGVHVSNVGGSFYDFRADHLTSTTATCLAEGGPEWGGLAAVEWTQHLRVSRGYDPGCESYARRATVLDAIYAAADRRTGTDAPAAGLAGGRSVSAEAPARSARPGFTPV